MISEEQLDQYRIEGTKLRVVRDADPKNDVRGIVVAWDDKSVAIRKQNRNIVKLNRAYHYQPLTEERHNEWLGEPL
jgi:RNase P/RNase MRP subunit p29